MKFYLGGPIWEEKDAGVTWRKKITQQLSKLGHKSLDPTTKKEESLHHSKQVFDIHFCQKHTKINLYRSESSIFKINVSKSGRIIF